MTVHASGGSPVAHPQRYHTVPTAVISLAEQQDRWLKQSELNQLSDFFKSGAKRLEIAMVLARHEQVIVASGASRIFFGGSAMAFLEQPPNREELPGYTSFPRYQKTAAPENLRLQSASPFANPLADSLGWLIEFVQAQFSANREPLPSGFRPINIRRYGPSRMRRSMRDLSWFLRYVAYAIVAGDPSILTVNVYGLRGVIPEDVTDATLIALKDMQWKALSFFEQDAEATDLIREYFESLIVSYRAEKPPIRLRQGVSNRQQGLQLPESYILAIAPRSKFVLKRGLSVTEQQQAIQAAYRQVFERDITRLYGSGLTDLESKVKSGEISTREFIRRLGKSRLYRREFYEPFVISRVIELAVRHFLGRGLSSIEEFQDYFEVISQNGLSALIDTLVDCEEYSDYFGEATVPYLRGLGLEAQECRNWGAQMELFKFSAVAHKVPQFITLFGDYQKPLPNQHPYGVGHDALEIQFGAIFPQPARQHPEHPAPFGKNHCRILISCGSNSHSGTPDLGFVPGAKHRLLKLDQAIHLNHSAVAQQGASVVLLRHSPDAVIAAAYRQVFGREVFAGQRLTATESKLLSNEIRLREFVRQLAKSRLFRSLYWDRLSVTQAIEYIHRRLLGRPTQGRREIGQYYELSASAGFYALIDALLDSEEYLEAFGEDTVPYERYITPRGFSMRAKSNWGNGLVKRAAIAIETSNPNQANNKLTSAWEYTMSVAAQQLANQAKQFVDSEGDLQGDDLWRDCIQDFNTQSRSQYSTDPVQAMDSELLN